MPGNSEIKVVGDGRLKRYWRWAAASFHAMVKDDCFTHAAAIAYYMIVSIFPLLLLIIGVLGYFLEEDETQQEVLALFGRYFPTGSLRVVRENISSIVESRNSLSLASLAGLIWSATLMFDAIHKSVDRALGTPNGAPFLRSKLKSLCIVFVLVSFAFASTFLTAQAAMTTQLESFLRTSGWTEWIWELGALSLSVLGRILPVVLTVIAFILAYRFLPAAEVSMADVWGGAVIAALTWEASKRVFVWYITRIADYSQVYGPISAILIMLLWAYSSALIFIWGAELSSEHLKFRKSRHA